MNNKEAHEEAAGMPLDDLRERVDQFITMQLPGQPMMMHVGTNRLVHDLWTEVRQLRAKIEERKKKYTDLSELVENASRLTINPDFVSREEVDQ